MNKITNEQIKLAAQEAYNNKKLTAQHPNKEGRVCKYTVGNCHCAIGATLNKFDPDTLEIIIGAGFNKNSIVSIGREYLDFEDWQFATYLQNAHDTWCTLAGQGGDTTKAEREFKELLV